MHGEMAAGEAADVTTSLNILVACISVHTVVQTEGDDQGTLDHSDRVTKDMRSCGIVACPLRMLTLGTD